MYPEGTDAEWFGIDALGYVGRFTTGGVGPVPKKVIDAKLPWFYETNNLGVSSRVKMLKELPRSDDFLDLAKRGIYGFDWDDVHRSKKNERKRYELISKPLTPILFDKIQEFFSQSRPVVTFENIEFNNSHWIDLTSNLNWISGTS